MVALLDSLASFGFGGVLLMMILRLALFTNTTHQQSHFTLRTQQDCVEVGKILEHDFYKIGYHDTSKAPMRIADSNKVRFYADVDNNGVMDSITYSTIQMSGKDARHFLLLRQVNAGKATAMQLGLRRFNLTYYDSTSQKTTVLNKIRAVRIALDLEADYRSVTSGGTDEVYPIVHWEQFIVPKAFHY